MPYFLQPNSARLLIFASGEQASARLLAAATNTKGPSFSRYLTITLLCLPSCRRSVAVEGWGGLWKGVSAAMARAIPVNAAIFLAVEGTRQVIADTEETVDQMVAKLSGNEEAAL